MRLRQARALFVTFAVAAGITAAFGTPWSGLNEGWRRVPEITVVSAAGDPRIAVVEEAIDFWNRSFAELRFRDASLLSFDGSRPRATASLVSADLGPLTAQTRSLRTIVAQRQVTCARFVRSASIDRGAQIPSMACKQPAIGNKQRATDNQPSPPPPLEFCIPTSPAFDRATPLWQFRRTAVAV